MQKDAVRARWNGASSLNFKSTQSNHYIRHACGRQYSALPHLSFPGIPAPNPPHS